MTATELQEALKEIAGDLRMYASQIDEHCDDPENQLPGRWHIEDTLQKYEDLLKDDR